MNQQLYIKISVKFVSYFPQVNIGFSWPVDTCLPKIPIPQNLPLLNYVVNQKMSDHWVTQSVIGELLTQASQNGVPKGFTHLPPSLVPSSRSIRYKSQNETRGITDKHDGRQVYI